MFVLVLFVSTGWSYLKFVQEARIEELEVELAAKQTELNRKQAIADQYETLIEQTQNARYYISNYDKVLYTSSNEDKVFDFLNQLNTGNSVVDFSFAFVDSTTQGEYGIINMDISGSGYYRNVINFIRKIEYSKPLNKVSQLTISPINDLENYGRVNFSFALRSFYDRIRLLENPSYDITSNTLRALYNPFFPLIRDIEPNEEDLTNVENSTLLALSNEKVFLLDQNGMMQKIEIGDEVYLGTLESINLNERSATFELNKGGLIERVTLEAEK